MNIWYQFKDPQFAGGTHYIHLRHFIELMEKSVADGNFTTGDTADGENYYIVIQFVNNTQQFLDDEEVPAGITPLFYSIDANPNNSMGFSMLHGVTSHGSAWDSEGGLA